VRRVVRLEQVDSGGWVDDNRTTYETDSLGRLQYEEREDWGGASWTSQYDITQEYDKNGNRTRYLKNRTGSAADYGPIVDLRYSYDAVNAITSLTDANDAGYACAVTADACGNITLLDETHTGVGLTPQTNHLYTYFDVDGLNRVVGQRSKSYQTSGTPGWYWIELQHEYDGLGRIGKSGYRRYLDGGAVPNYSVQQHVWDQSGWAVQNTDGSSGYGTRWAWAGADNAGAGPVFGPNADTASQNADNVNAEGGAGNPQRWTYIDPTPTSGDSREFWGQGRPMGKDSTSAWGTTASSQPQNGNQNIVRIK
jgi:hypothetical protein